MGRLSMHNNYIITGKNKLSGSIDVQGAKNSSLPILAACLIGDGEITLKNCPNLSDTKEAVNILTHIGCTVTQQGTTLIIRNDDSENHWIPEQLMGAMRSSIIFLGALISRFNKASLCLPGGCDLGPRPIDLHLKAFSELGINIEQQDGNIECNCPLPIHGKMLHLAFPSVGATENIILATVVSNGTTVIQNAASEPEIVDLAVFLNKRGAKISGMGTSEIVIEGVTSLHGCEHTICSDRIVAATYMGAAAITGGELLLNNVSIGDLGSVISVFEQCGCLIKPSKDSIWIKAPEKIKSVHKIITLPHPGFPTDAQAIVMALVSIADKTSIFEENIFDNRYKHVPMLNRMGANIDILGKIAVVRGVPSLYGSKVECTDLRGGAALVLAGLSAFGRTTISKVSHIERGYDDLPGILRSVGADIVAE